MANVIVQELVDLGFTTYEEWDTSAGEYKMYEDVYALGKDVLIVAGADRTATGKAALDLIAEMQIISFSSLFSFFLFYAQSIYTV